jgi:hypothetical protein
MTGARIAISLLGILAACSTATPRQSGLPRDTDGETQRGPLDAGKMTAPKPTCGRKTDAGVLICCGAETELPGFSCVDLTQPGGEFGIYGHCIEEGDEFDGKVAGGTCCEGLTRTHPAEPTSEIYPGFASGCGPGSAPISLFICLRCGNSVCEPTEQSCNCPVDCAVDGGSIVAP